MCSIARMIMIFERPFLYWRAGRGQELVVVATSLASWAFVSMFLIFHWHVERGARFTRQIGSRRVRS